jgi:hypothetical protein
MNSRMRKEPIDIISVCDPVWRLTEEASGRRRAELDAAADLVSGDFVLRKLGS